MIELATRLGGLFIKRKVIIELPSDDALITVIILAGEKVRLFRFVDVILLQTDCAKSASHGRL